MLGYTNHNTEIDILEQDIEELSPYLLKILLTDNTTKNNIYWACNEYEKYGTGYKREEQIFSELITGKNTKVIQPRTAKSKQEQQNRTKQSAEVFTPSWLCCEMIDIFDTEWKSKYSGNNWQKYIDLRCLEITCGEAPFLVSRYDTTTGNILPIEKRIGLLDRKLFLINKHTKTEIDWFLYTKRAFQSTYGYEYQGDNLLLARENLLWTFIEYFENKFNKKPKLRNVEQIAKIISWNIWQMDGLTNTAPFYNNKQIQLFNEIADSTLQCKIKNWRSNKVFNFNDLKGNKTMKFDVVIGNPPYQEMNSNNKMSRSIYPDFVKQSKLCGKLVSLIMPARWMSGENGPYRETQGFIKEILDGNHIKNFTLYPNSTDLFSSVDIKGGVCFFIWDENYSKDLVNYILCEKGEKKEIKTSFKIADNIIIRFPELISILQKSRNQSMGSMKMLVSSRNPFGFVSDLFVKNNEGVKRISEIKEKDDDYLVHGLLKSKRVIRYIPNEELKKNIEGAKAYKVFLPRANGSGVFGEVFSTPMIGTPMIGTPMSICTDTFLQVGKFNNESEAINLLKYIKTKYFRAMVGIRKTAVFNYKDCFEFVPLQDFTDKSDIDWSVSVPEIDKQLYKKYDLDKEEIDFIETKIKPME